MSKAAAVCTLMVAALLVPWGPAPAAEAAGDTVEGVLTHVELVGSPRMVRVRTADGRQVEAHIANRTHVTFKEGAAGFTDTPELSDLQPGMTVRFKTDGGVLDRIHVIGVPAGARPRERARPLRKGNAPVVGGEQRLVKARLQEVDRTRGEVRADVAGRSERFRVLDRGRLRSFRTGDLVILSLDADGNVTAIRSAALEGRVNRVDSRRREVVMDVDGRQEVYGVDDKDMLDALRIGSRVRFEVEERARGRRVITAVF